MRRRLGSASVYGWNTTWLANAGAMIYFCVVAYYLLTPQTGGRLADVRAFPVQRPDLLYTVIVAEVMVCLTFALDRRLHCSKGPARLICILSAVFTSAVAVSAFRQYRAVDTVVTVVICLGPMCYLVSSFLRARSDLFKHLPSLVLAILAVYSVTTVVHLKESGASFHSATVAFASHGTRLAVIFEHPNHLGNLLSFGVVLSFVLAATSDRWQKAAMLWGQLCVLVFALVHTYSRGAWLGCGIGIATSIPCLWRQTAPRALATSIVALVAVIAVNLLLTDPGHVAAERVDRCAHLDDASVSNRVHVWRSTIGMVGDYWLTGVGIGQFDLYYNRSYRPPRLSNNYYCSALNNYLTLAVEGGVPIVLLYLWLLVALCRAGTRAMSGGTAAASRIGMLCGVYSMLVFGLTTYTLGRVYSTLLVWSTLGYLTVQETERDSVDWRSEGLDLPVGETEQ